MKECGVWIFKAKKLVRVSCKNWTKISVFYAPRASILRDMEIVCFALYPSCWSPVSWKKSFVIFSLSLISHHCLTQFASGLGDRKKELWTIHTSCLNELKTKHDSKQVFFLKTIYIPFLWDNFVVFSGCHYSSLLLTGQAQTCRDLQGNNGSTVVTTENCWRWRLSGSRGSTYLNLAV